MNYELTKELKDAGWPQDHDCIDGKYLGGGAVGACLCMPTIPTLSELIYACGEDFYDLTYYDKKWMACRLTSTVTHDMYGEGSTPEEAVARLWIALNKK